MKSMLLTLVLMLAIYLGFILISKVPSTLHTPLMSELNAISGITLLGALESTGSAHNSTLTYILGIIAIACATFNVLGGYLVTDRMFQFFKHKESPKK